MRKQNASTAVRSGFRPDGTTLRERSSVACSLCAALLLVPALALANADAMSIQPGEARAPAIAPAGPATTRPAVDRATLESNFSKKLTRATLEGSFTTSTGAGADAGRLSKDSYTLGAVRKLDDRTWLFESKMRVRGIDVMIPLHLTLEWAGDTPVIVLDDFTIPGMGVFSARVLFYDGHYCGYWKHGERGGTLFGIINPAG